MTQLEQAIAIAHEKGFVIYTQPNQLNIWGVRSENKQPNLFDDEIHVFANGGTMEVPNWYYFVFPATTDAGTHYLLHPTSKSGTSLMKEGQYINAYALGLHRRQYKALVQVGRIKIYKDSNRNNVLDFDIRKVVNGTYGINIHRANKVGTSYAVDIHSAGCQVFKSADDFSKFIKLCDLHKQLYGNKFTYTLVTETDFKKKTQELTV